MVQHAGIEALRLRQRVYALLGDLAEDMRVDLAAVHAYTAKHPHVMRRLGALLHACEYGMSINLPVECPMCCFDMLCQTYVMDCGHAVCIPCLRRWLPETGCCPLCRGEVSMPPVARRRELRTQSMRNALFSYATKLVLAANDCA
jgi:hypothetical protein